MSKLKYYDGTNWKTVNGQILGDTLPIGAIVPYGSATAPTNWLVCDGSAVSRTTYAELFAVIGTSFGNGDGSTTFNLPNLKGKVAVGQDTNDADFDTMGETGGSKELQAHTHEVYSAYGQGSSTKDALLFGSNAIDNEYRYYGYGFTNFLKDAGTGNAGNLQPYQVVCYIIKVKQSAGVVAQVENTSSNSQTNVYSCNYTNACNTYSTSETFTGKYWIDGKPIYRVCKNIGYLPNNARIIPSFEGLIPDNVNVVSIDGITHRFNNDVHDYRPIKEMTITLLYRPVNYTLYVDTNTDNSLWEAIVIIEYTKPTD